MQIKLRYDAENPKHKDVVTAVAWTGADEVISCGNRLCVKGLLLRQGRVSRHFWHQSRRTMNTCLRRRLRLKLVQDWDPVHQDAATSLSWNGVQEVLSCGDDHRIYRWNVISDEIETYFELPQDVYPVTMQWPPKTAGQSASVKKGNTLLLITTTDGRFFLFSRGGRAEKVVQAHKGAILTGNWSPDGSEILTSGEDGYLRIWSRAGMLRSTLYHANMGIYASCWGPDGLFVLHSVEKNLALRSTAAGNKPTVWKAHAQIVLCVAWNQISRLIISGGEDGRYNVWDSEGQLLYSSVTHDTPITSLAWSPSGDLFSVGGTKLLRLCDRFGWCHYLQKPKSIDSIYCMQWSEDGTQFAGTSADGNVFLANVIKRSIIWESMEAVVTSTKCVTFTEYASNSKDRLLYKDRVIQLSLNHGHLIVVIPTQVYIYEVTSIETPIVCELKETASISLILQSKRNFTLCGSLGITSRTYEGRQVAHMKWPDMKSEMLNYRTASLAEDMLALIDQADLRIIRVFDPQTGKQLTEISMRSEGIQVALAQTDVYGRSERMLAIVDRTNDLYLFAVKRTGTTSQPHKLGMMITSMMWHTEAPILAVIRDTRLRIYYFPEIIFVDESILDSTWEDKDLGELGRTPEIISYSASRICIRRPDGVLIATSANNFAPVLHQFALEGRFVKARRLCRYVNDKHLWGIMAGLASWKGDLGLAEISFAEIGHYDKVSFLRCIRATEDDETRAIYEQLFVGGLKKTEAFLLKQGQLVEAVGLNIRCMHWLRALELTHKYNGDMDILLETRQGYLDRLNLEEYLQSYIDAVQDFSTSTGVSETETEEYY